MAQPAKEELLAAIAATPDDPHGYNAYAIHLLTVEGNPDEAEEQYKLALSKDPSHLESLANYAVFQAEHRGEFGEARKLFQRALKASPGKNEVLNGLAVLAHSEGDNPNAEKLYKQVIQQDASHVPTLLNYAVLLTSDGRVAEAADLYETAVQADKTGSAAHAYGVFSFQHLKDTGKAGQMFAQSLEINPENPELLVDYATYLEKIEQDHDRAGDLYQKATALDPKHALAAGNYGLFLMDVSHDHDEAEKYLDIAIGLEPQNPLFLGNKALFLYNVRKDATAALKLFEKALAKVPEDLTLLSCAGLAATDVRRYDDADGFYRRGLRAHPNDPFLLANYALFNKDVRKEYDSAELHFRRAIAADTKCVTSALSGYAMLLYEQRGDKDRAIELLEKAAKERPNDADALSNYGSLLLEAANSKPAPEDVQTRSLAFQMLQRAYTLDDSHPGANAALGHYYYAVAVQPDKAAHHLDAALQRNPKSVDALLSLALLSQHVTKENSKAERYYKQLLQVSPNNVNALLSYASFTHTSLGKTKRASMLFEKALVAGPSDPSANNSMACFLIDEKSDLDRAENLLRKALESDPDYVPALANLALMSVRLNRDADTALELYDRAFRAAGESVSAKLASEFAIFLHLTVKDYDRAEEMYLKALEIDDGYEDAIVHYSKFLKDIRRNPAKANAMYNRKVQLAKKRAGGDRSSAPSEAAMSRETSDVSRSGTETTEREDAGKAESDGDDKAAAATDESPAEDAEPSPAPPSHPVPVPPPVGRPDRAVPSPRARQRQQQETEEAAAEEEPAKPDIRARLGRRGMNFNPARRQSVSAEVLGRFFGQKEQETKVIPKTPEQQQQIQLAIGRNMLFAHLEDSQKKEVTDAMFEVRKPKGDNIIVQGADGDNFYVLADGSCDVTLLKQGETVHAGTIHPGGSFGELALMYNTPRAATITAAEDCVLWAVDRTTFRRILLISTLNRRRQYEDFLGRVPILSDLTAYEKSSLADAVSGLTVEDGEVIVKQGDPGEAFFLIIDGTVQITRKDSVLAPEKEIGTLTTGEYFGEIALLTDAPRQATVTSSGQTRLAKLDRDAFDRLLGPCLDILRRNLDQYEAIMQSGLDRPDGNISSEAAMPSPSKGGDTASTDTPTADTADTTDSRAAAEGTGDDDATGGAEEEDEGAAAQEGTTLGEDFAAPSFARKRKGGVSAEAMGRFQEEHADVVVEKSTESIDRLHATLDILKERNFLFRGLDATQEQRLVDAMYEEKKERGEYVIRQGEEGAHFYMLAEGQCQVLISARPGEKPKAFGDLHAGDTFGELALMYNCPRAASIVAVTPVSLWVLDRSTFRHVLQESAIEKRRAHESFLETVPLFKDLTGYEKTTIADCLFHTTVPENKSVFAAGDQTNRLYFVVEGSAVVVNKAGDQIKEVGTGDHFGEDALVTDSPVHLVSVSAAPGCDLKLYFMDRASVNRVLTDKTRQALKARVLKDLGAAAVSKVITSPSKAPTISLGASLHPGRAAGPGGMGGGGGLLAPNPALFAARRKSVSAEVFSQRNLEKQEALLPEVPKTDGQIAQLRRACLKNFLFSGLDSEQLQRAMNVMFEVKHPPGVNIITQGDDGDNFYVLAQGKCEVSMTRGNETHAIGVVEPGGSFGELALMYNTPRAATVTSLTDCTLWAIDRSGFRQLILGSSLRKRRVHEEFLEAVPIFKTLTPYERSTIADALVEETFKPGELVFRQGAIGDKFYLVQKGEAVVTSSEGPNIPLKEIQRLSRGAYFGEIALLRDDGRLFSISAGETEPLVVSSLGRDAFKRLLGPIREILQRNTELIYSQEVKEALEGSDIEDDDEEESYYNSDEESERPDTAERVEPAAAAPTTTDDQPGQTDDDAAAAHDEARDATARLAARGRHNQGRRQGVSAEVLGRFFEQDDEIKVVPKTDEQVAQIRQSIAGNFLFNALDEGETKEVTDAMFEVRHGPREDIIRQGDDGDNFYVIAEGQCEALISKGGAARRVAEIGPGGSFGELALMYNTPRAATVRSVGNVVLWAVDRTTFRRCVLNSTIKKRQRYEQFLSEVPIFESLTNYERAQLADAFQTVEFKDGQAIVTQGDAGDTFYVLVEGECAIEHSPSHEAQPVDVGRIHAGRYFGELALLTSKPRAVTIRALGPCKLVALERAAFDSLLGPIIDVLQRNADNYESLKDSAAYKAALDDKTQEPSPEEVSSKILDSSGVTEAGGKDKEVKQEVLTSTLPRAMFDPRARRASVSAEVLGRFFSQKEEEIKVVPKSEEQVEQIRRSIKKNFLFQDLDPSQLKEVIDSMFEAKHSAGSVVIKQGDDGDNFYVCASGRLSVAMTRNGVETNVGDVLPGGSFGELALMYNTPRAATITTAEDCVLWAVDRTTFRRILLISTLNKRRQYEQFLSSVPILQSLTTSERSSLADAFTSVVVSAGERVVAQGDSGDAFYIIEQGEFVITHRPDRNAPEIEIGRLGPDDYFGEVSLLTTKPRAASVTAVGDARLVQLSRGAFTRLLGPCLDILKRNLNNYTELKTDSQYKDALSDLVDFETESGDGISPTATRPGSEIALATPPPASTTMTAEG